jgi:predicted transcriptional regulator
MTTKSKIKLNQEKEKLEIIKWVTNLSDDTALERLRLLRMQPKKIDWWEHISEEEQAAIEKGIEDVKAGRVPHKEVKKLYEKWL